MVKNKGMIMKTILFAMIIFLSLAGCISPYNDMKIIRAESQQKIYLGMPINEVVNIVGRSPNYMPNDLATEIRSDGVYKIWRVHGGGLDCNYTGTYFFKFKDDKLISWSKQ